MADNKDAMEEDKDEDKVPEEYAAIFRKTRRGSGFKNGEFKNVGKATPASNASKPKSFAKAVSTGKKRKPKSFKFCAWLHVEMILHQHQFPAEPFRGKIRDWFDWLDGASGAGTWGLLPLNQTSLQSATPPLMHRSDVPDTHREVVRFVHCFNKEEDFLKGHQE